MSIALIGQHGARATRTLRSGAVEYKAGEFIPPSVVMGWPISNRRALENTNRVEFLTKPAPVSAKKEKPEVAFWKMNVAGLKRFAADHDLHVDIDAAEGITAKRGVVRAAYQAKEG